tara:strand:- start:725 stop:1627 length:903 start_codon:yes stop_codon:yes gene_type:complete
MQQYLRLNRYQSGVALLQVLLISAVISVLAIRFTQTARDQIEMAADFDLRIRAQMEARSVFNEIIFSQITTSVSLLANNSSNPAVKGRELNRYGEEILWRDGILVSTQDLNGLLPRLYPRYFLWRILLEQLAVSSEDIDRYLGVWKDMQDTDTNSWVEGEEEPVMINGVTRFPNRLAQTDVLIKVSLLDNQDLADSLLKHSTFYPVTEVNLFNMPMGLLSDLLGSNLADSIHRVRGDANISFDNKISILPLEYRDNRLSLDDSSALKIIVSVPLSEGFWAEAWSVRLAPGGARPFYQLSN